ncbi:MAG: cupin domain-containing protein [Patescibacteria group bacterium]|jgi:mannose-6-phosphate isomerase-like protein (cupin superfamily)
MVKKEEKIIIKEFSRVNQLMNFFPARNLKAESFVVREGRHLGAHRTLSNPEVVGVLQGIATVAVDSEIYKIRKDEMIYIPRGRLYNVYNNNKSLLKLILIVSKI